MKIAVCIKRVPDTELRFAIAPDGKSLDPAGLKFDLSDFDGYAVEVAGTGNTRHLVPVSVGLTDDADGLAQVTGALAPGQRVVVPAS